MSTAPAKPFKYIAELFKEFDYDPRLAIADNVFSRQYSIFQFSIAPHPTSDNYWLDWGGSFDNPVGSGLQIFMDLFLTEVFSESNLIGTLNSYYIDTTNNLVYMHLPRNPWRYFTEYAAVYENSGSTFSTAPKRETNLSDIKYGNVTAYPRMQVPKLNNKLSDNISGVTVYNSFKISLFNNDGDFDGLNVTEYFNTPLQISKTTEDATTIEDFNRVRYGIIDDISVDKTSIVITATDQFYKMNREYCRPMTVDDYPNLPDGNVNKLMPVAWGDVSRVELFQVNKDTADPPEWIDYIALNPQYITAVSKVYDDDGNELTHTFNSDNGIIRVTELDGDGEVIEGESADVTGLTDNSIGQIIIYALEQNENIAYVEGIWDITETAKYLAIDATLGFYFDEGSTRDLIESVLKNDIAYLIQKNNGLLTIRQWGQTYSTHFLPSWLTTKFPTKNFQDASKYFCSSVKIQYNKNYVDDNFQNIYLDDTQERTIFERYRRSYTVPLESEIDNSSDRTDLADRMLDRFGEVRETIKIGIGLDTFGINLLDTIQYEGYINDREFSEYSTWIVKEADPGQDEIVMEGLEITYLMTFDGEPAELDLSYWGINADEVT